MTELTVEGSQVDDPEGTTTVVAFDYIKAPDFRVVWADGVVGGVTPQEKIHCVLYAERPSIPQRQVFQVSNAKGPFVQLGEENLEERVSRNSVVREMACDVFMTATTARNLASWLLQQADELDRSSNGS